MHTASDLGMLLIIDTLHLCIKSSQNISYYTNVALTDM